MVGFADWTAPNIGSHKVICWKAMNGFPREMEKRTPSKPAGPIYFQQEHLCPPPSMQLCGAPRTLVKRALFVSRAGKWPPDLQKAPRNTNDFSTLILGGKPLEQKTPHTDTHAKQHTRNTPKPGRRWVPAKRRFGARCLPEVPNATLGQASLVHLLDRHLVPCAAQGQRCTFWDTKQGHPQLDHLQDIPLKKKNIFHESHRKLP